MKESLNTFLARPAVQTYLNRPRVKPILIFAGLGILTSFIRMLVIPPDGSTTLPLFNLVDILARLLAAITWFLGVIICIRPGKRTLTETLIWVILGFGFAFLLTWADRPAAVLMLLPVVARYWLTLRQAVALLLLLLAASVLTYLLIPPVPDLRVPAELGGLVMLVVVTLSQGAFTYTAFELLVQNESKQAELDAANQELRDSQTERLQAAALEERTFISRELHDTLGHELAALRLEVQRARKLETKAADPSERVLEALEGAMNRSGRALEQLQAVVSALRTPTLDGTLFQALQELIAAWPEQVRLTFNTPEPPLTTSQKLAFYRGVQETLTNAYKYAPGQPVQIQVNQPPEQLEIIVHNTKAAGPSISRPVPSSGKNGLRQLRQRFQELGGSITVDEQEDGFTVWLTLSLQK